MPALAMPALSSTVIFSLPALEMSLAICAIRSGVSSFGGSFTAYNVPLAVLDVTNPNDPGNTIAGILGMHRIEERPVVRKGEVVVRPMMYLALSYDHRIVDGKEAVTFLVRVKENLEDPQRFILEL